MHRNFPLFKTIAAGLILPLFIRDAAYAQCTSSSAHNASSAASVSFTGSRFGYDIPNNALLADNVYATATAILSVLSGPTQNLTLTNFGFSVPQNATICGVVAVIKKKAANVNVLSTVTDNSVKLVKGGTVSGNNKALVGNWTTTNTSFTYGGDADTWGLSLTPSDVNASGFGVAFSANISGTISLIPSAQIDNIQLTVYYTISTLPVVLSDFKASANANTVVLKWKTDKETSFSHYDIERSADGIHFIKLGEVQPSLLSKDYSFNDAYPNSVNYYRLKMVDLDGSFEYSSIVSAFVNESLNHLVIAPNPAQSNCIFSFRNFREGHYSIEIINSNGQLMSKRMISVTKDLSLPISISVFSKGFYSVKVYSDDGMLCSCARLLRE